MSAVWHCVLKTVVCFKKKKESQLGIKHRCVTLPWNLCNCCSMLEGPLYHIEWTVVLSKECECTETALQCLWSTNVAKLPAAVGSACVFCACPVTETVWPLRRLPTSNCCPEVLFLLPNPIKMCLLKEQMCLFSLKIKKIFLKSWWGTVIVNSVSFP